ncbi:hypothetical protein SCBWM1_gp69 [Synechococcus phage S-CBWM1]|uniref:Uncharacterized protein n=1 Tax=Synechococcus phage S-CBWM1 TaxID=2053653 RepID=A0A3G1L3J3_9CAUD|nr:hypothetical protein HOU61_gp128 [Synechococcus phage S-CBWM1]ATW62753.1 hypothetical protein SCBWM1_gp69 [Synechococcus phage S-CBWM1]
MNTRTHFSWLASEDPKDPSGVATFTCNGMSVKIELDDFTTAARLSHLIRAAYDLGRSDSIDKMIRTIPRFLNEQRYD